MTDNMLAFLLASDPFHSQAESNDPNLCCDDAVTAIYLTLPEKIVDPETELDLSDIEIVGE